MKTQGIIWALVAVVIGTIYLMMATLGPLKDTNLGFGLTAGLSAVQVGGGYNLANVVLFIVFLVVVIVLGVYVMKGKKS